jgi:hypothetical protein
MAFRTVPGILGAVFLFGNFGFQFVASIQQREQSQFHNILNILKNHAFSAVLWYNQKKTKKGGAGYAGTNPNFGCGR